MNRNTFILFLIVNIFLITFFLKCNHIKDCEELTCEELTCEEFTIETYSSGCEFFEQEFSNANRYTISNSSKIIEFCLGIRNDTLYILQESTLSDTTYLSDENIAYKEFYMANVYRPYNQIPLLDINMRGKDYIHYFELMYPLTAMSSSLYRLDRRPNDTIYSIVQELFETNLTFEQDDKRKYRFIKYSKNRGIIEFYEFGTCNKSLLWFY